MKARLNSEENSFVQSGLVEDDDPLGGRFVKFDKIQSFLALGAFFTFVEAPELHSPMLAVIGLLVLALGARVTFNAFRRRSKMGQSRSDDGHHV